MAQISVFAQPGLAFMGAAQSARENRLATAALEAEQATEQAQQRIRQQAFQALQTGQADPAQVAANLASMGLREDAALVANITRTQQDAAARRDQMIAEGLSSAARVAAQGPEQFENTASAFAQEYNIPVEQARERLRRTMQLTPPTQQNLPASIREYEYARSQGETRSFNDWEAARRAAGRAQTNVNVSGPTGPQIGTIPQGFQLVQDPATNALRMEPIPGGPAAREIEGEQAEADRANAQQRRAAEATFSRMNDTVGLIRESAQRVSPLTAGLGGAALRNIPGSPAVDLDRTIDTIRARFGFDELQAMREASPTGGALGQVTVREIEFLQAVLRNFDLAQSPEQLRNNLIEAEQLYQESMARVAEAYRADFGVYPPGFQGGAGVTPPPNTPPNRQPRLVFNPNVPGGFEEVPQ